MANIFRYLEKLRARPEHERRRVLLIVVSSITAAIFLIWLGLLPRNITAAFRPHASIANTPFAELEKAAAGALGNLKDIFEGSETAAGAATTTPLNASK